jgi:hypothetical protein
MSTLDQAQEYLLILEAYAPEQAREISARERAGIDITDELYEALCVHDELAAEGFLAGTARPDPDDGWNPHAREFTDSPRCALCHEATTEDDRAEMYNPAKPDVGSVICHPQCGLSAGLEVA